MTISDTSMATIGNLFFEQVKEATLKSNRQQYRAQMGRILQAYAPETSEVYRRKVKY